MPFEIDCLAHHPTPSLRSNCRCRTRTCSDIVPSDRPPGPRDVDIGAGEGLDRCRLDPGPTSAMSP